MKIFSYLMKNYKQGHKAACGNKKRGFTLIELVVVLAILSMVLMIAAPKFLGLVENSKISADLATVKMLNSATSLFRTTGLEVDPFEDNTQTNEQLLEKLVESGYLSSVIKPQTEDAKFLWILYEDKWYLSSKYAFYEIKTSDAVTINDQGRLDGSYAGEPKDIFIPDSINDIYLKEIYQDAFENKGLTVVNFGNNSKIEKIHARAFQNNDLTKIIFPDSIKEIHTQAFINNKLAEIKLPTNLQHIQSHVFKDNKLTEIKLPDTLQKIDGYAFENNNDLNKITIGGNVTSIGNGTFDYRYNNISTKRTVKFRDAYSLGSSGTYIWNGSDWIKQ